MLTIPVAGRSNVSFYKDDTIENVRQHISIAMDSHPDRLFIEVKLELPADYYENTRNWESLFLRMSLDGKTLDPVLGKTYGLRIREIPFEDFGPITFEEWMSRPQRLEPVFKSETDISEWCILGVPRSRSMVLPTPPTDIALSPTQIPVLLLQSLFETIHKEPVIELRATERAPDATQGVTRVYFPFFKTGTPDRLSPSVVRSLNDTHTQLGKVLALNAPEGLPSVLRAKWYVPFTDTSFPMPRNRFEQMFYGLTVSKTTPYIGYFTSKQELMRHKWYVENPKNKKPANLATWRSWTTTTLPNRKMPTLLLYRGTDRTSFDRIAITPKDITFTVYRSKAETKTLDALKTDIAIWFSTLDSIVPFIKTSDLKSPQWELQDISLLVRYRTDVSELDMRRFPCLTSIFHVDDNLFQLLRAEHTNDSLSPLELRAYRALRNADTPTPQVLMDELQISESEASALIKKFVDLGDEIDLERVMRKYPTFKFSTNEILLTSVTNEVTAVRYADILRYVLTTHEAIDDVCPRRVEAVSATAAVVQESELVANTVDDALDDLDLGDPPPAAAPGGTNAAAAFAGSAPPPPPKGKKVDAKVKSTYNYFNKRLQEFDPETFDTAVYPSSCDKTKQVVVLTPEEEARIPPEFNPRTRDAILPLENPSGIAFCPHYWCMRDLIPLRKDQLKLVDGALRCPVCGGKVRSEKNEDITEFSVIERKDAKFPAFMTTVKSGRNGRKMPCCYTKAHEQDQVQGTEVQKGDEAYVLSSSGLPKFRIGYLVADIAGALKLDLKYSESIKRADRLETGKGDFFRIGLGRPTESLPKLLGETKAIPQPKDAPEQVALCSFYRTWKDLGEGSTESERIVSGVQRAYETGRMSIFDEVEYVTSILKCRVIQLHTASQSVSCGFWSDTLSADSRTLVMIDTDVLGYVERRRKTAENSLFVYTIDLQKAPFTSSTRKALFTLHEGSCMTSNPSIDTAVTELRLRGHTTYEFVLDPFKRVQAVFVPKVIVLPVQPVNKNLELLPPEIRMTRTRDGYHAILDEDLPTQDDAREFLRTARDPGYAIVADAYTVDGVATEFILKCQFRSPFRPAVAASTTDPVKSVFPAVRLPNQESNLIDGLSNADDAALAGEISYHSEVFDFLLFSLSKDILRDEYATLHDAIETGEGLVPELGRWFDAETHWTPSGSPQAFVSKVRAPCGQFTNKDACNSSTLCGWQGGSTCKVTVKSTPTVDKKLMIRQIAKTLRENGKQRALVLDNRLSPFFSTVLYLEMPHELITTVVPESDRSQT